MRYGQRSMSVRSLIFALCAFSGCAFVPSNAPFMHSMRKSKLILSAEGGIVPVNDDNVKATVAIAGGSFGFVVGGPVTAGLFAVGANYIANKVL